MNNLLLSAAIGDIAGMPYEFKGRTKDYNTVDLLLPTNTYTDDTVCTFACAEALLRGLNMAENLWNRCRADFYRGFGGRFARWLIAKEIQPSYHSYGNGSGMRVSLLVLWQNVSRSVLTWQQRLHFLRMTIQKVSKVQ